MRKQLASVFVVLALVGAGAVSAASGPKKESIRIDRPALVGSTLVPPGTYQLELIPGQDTVRLVEGKRTVVEAPCKVGLGQPVYPGTALHYRSGVTGPDRLVKIVFADSKLAIDLAADTAGATGAVANAADRP